MNSADFFIVVETGAGTSNSDDGSLSDSLASDRRKSALRGMGVDGLPSRVTTGLSEAAHGQIRGQQSPISRAANVSQEQSSQLVPSGEALSDVLPTPLQLFPEQPSTPGFDASNTFSASRTYLSTLDPVSVRSSASVPPPPLRSGRLASSRHSLVSGSNLSSGCSLAPEKHECSELEQERMRLNILDRRMAEVGHTLRPNVQRPFPLVPTNLQLQGCIPFGTDYGTGVLSKTSGDANHQLSDLPAEQSLRSLSEAWTLGFQSGLQSTA